MLIRSQTKATLPNKEVEEDKDDLIVVFGLVIPQSRISLLDQRMTSTFKRRASSKKEKEPMPPSVKISLESKESFFWKVEKWG